MKTMRAVIAQEPVGPRGLALVERPVPAGEGVAIRVRAAGVGYPDLLASYGKHQRTPRFPFVPGLEVAGEVLSDGTGEFAPGDRVMAFVSGFGGYADQVMVPPAQVQRIPAGFTPAQAATFMLNYHTAYFALVVRAQVRAGESVLVLGAGGGVGLASVQLGKALGARVFAAASSEEKRSAASKSGADEVLAADETLVETVSDLTGGRGVQVVVDPVGDSLFDVALRTVGFGGRYLTIGFAGGAIPHVRLNRLLMRNIGVLGVAWGPDLAGANGLPDLAAALIELAECNPGIAPPVTKVLPLSEAAQALQDLEERAVVGRTVLHTGADSGIVSDWDEVQTGRAE